MKWKLQFFCWIIADMAALAVNLKNIVEFVPKLFSFTSPHNYCGWYPQNEKQNANI